MNDFFLLMWKPLLACFVLTGIHAYLGIHVIERGVIFVDLSLAQIAALGAAFALLMGYEVNSQPVYGFSLGATFLGAAVFSITRSRRGRIPQEAVIGIVYAVAAALTVLILSRNPHGDEEIQHMLVGNILLVEPPEIIKMILLYGMVGFLHWKFRKTFLLISTDPDRARQEKISLRFWDLVFYVTFGLVVTSSVSIAGVLLVFSFLIVPSVGAILCSNRVTTRLIAGWMIGAVASIVGITMSYFADLPTGATLVCAFGGVLLTLALVCKWRDFGKPA